MYQCLICDSDVETFISFGRMPIANGFLSPDEFAREYFFELKAGHCSTCNLVQLTELLDPARLFHSNYAYFSSISRRMADHFKRFAEMVIGDYLRSDDPLIFEMGSNDGILLQNFARAGFRHLGVEPSANVAAAALEKGVNTITRFFDEQAAIDIRREYGPARVFLGANVICHLPNLHSVIRGIDILLEDEGLFIFEEPYLVEVLQKTAYDQIYDEHFTYYCLHPLIELFKRYEMEIVKVIGQSVHGGSMRYIVSRSGRRPVEDSVYRHLELEEAMGVKDPRTYKEFSRRVCESRDRLTDLLRQLKAEGKSVSGYGATSKSTTVTNFCGIGPDLVDYISDTTPGKQGKYSPGTHIPVVAYDRFKQDYPDYALLFAWNHKEEILEKEEEFRRRGGKFITYIPAVEII